MEPNGIPVEKNTETAVMGEYQKDVECGLKGGVVHSEGASALCNEAGKGVVGEVLDALSVNMKPSKDSKEGDEEDKRSSMEVGAVCNEEGLAGRISLVEIGKDCENGKLAVQDKAVIVVETGNALSVDLYRERRKEGEEDCKELAQGSQVPAEDGIPFASPSDKRDCPPPEAGAAEGDLMEEAGGEASGKGCVVADASNDEKVEDVSSECKMDEDETMPNRKSPSRACDGEEAVRAVDDGCVEKCSQDVDFKGKKRKVDELALSERRDLESEGESEEGRRRRSGAAKEGVEWGRKRRRKRKSKRRKPSSSSNASLATKGRSSSSSSSSSASSSSSSLSADEREGTNNASSAPLLPHLHHHAAQLQPRGKTATKEDEKINRKEQQECGSEDEQQFCLRWNNFLTNITSQFGTLRDDEDFVDVTLACGGMQVKAHRVVLSACSPYFKRMFKSVPYCQHPVVFLEGIQPSHLLSLLAFMYCGEVGVRRGQLPSLLSTAHALQIRGLTEMGNSSSPNSGDDDEENVILSAKKQASAVEKALKDIGLCETTKESVSSERMMNLQSTSSPPKMNKRDSGRASPVITRQRRNEMQRQGCSEIANDSTEHPLMVNSTAVNRTKESRKESEDAEVGTTEEQQVVISAPLPSSPCIVRNVPIDVPVLRATKKNHQSAFTVNNGPMVEELVQRVGCPSPVSESTVLCDMAATLVDVRIGTGSQSPAILVEEKAERHHHHHTQREGVGLGGSGVIGVDGAVVLPPMSSSSLSPHVGAALGGGGDRGGGNLSRHGWDPGEKTQSSQFEPRIDLVTGADFGLIKPKEEVTSYSEVDVEDVDMSLSHVVEPKMEYQDLSSAEGETSRSCGIPVAMAPESSSSVNLSSTQQHHYRPHILGTPIISSIQQSRIPPSTSSSTSSQMYSHFLPPMSSTSFPPRLSPGNTSQLADGSKGHLKWEMPRPCPVCCRIYSNNSNLRRHLRTIHEDYYEKYMQ